MNHLTKSKIILYLAAIFVAGGVSGVAFGWREKSTPPPDPRTICNHFRHRLETELGLNADQVRQLEPLLQKRARRMEEIHSRTVKEIEELIRTSNDEIATTLQLNSAQRQTLQQMEKDRRARFGGKGRKEGSSPPTGDRPPAR